MGIFTGVIGAWLLRRGMELGGLIGTLVVFYTNLPPGTQGAIGRALTGKWQDVTIGAIAPIALALWGYIWSLRATTKDQVVSNGKKIAMKELPSGTQTVIKEKVVTAVEKRPTLAERLGGLFSRKP